MKIAMLGQKRIPSREGGVEVVVEELAVRMASQGHKVTCYDRRGHHIAGKKYDVEEVTEYKGVNIKSVCTIDRKGLAAVSSSFFAALRATFGGYDVIHFHAEGPCAMMWIPKLFGKRCVATIHGLDWKRDKWQGGFGEKYIHFGEKVAAKLADSIIVLNRSDRQYFRETYGRETYMIPNGKKEMNCRTPKIIKEKYGLGKDDYILYLGRLVPEKNIELLIRSFKQSETDKKLVIAGGVSDSADYFAFLKEEAAGDPNIIFTDFVCGQELEELYSNSYMYVLPSNLEGMPMTLLEAMGYGSCCVVSDIPEIAEMTDGRAFVFERENEEQLTDILRTLCRYPELVEKKKKETLESFKALAGWDEVVEETLEIYEGQDFFEKDQNSGSVVPIPERVVEYVGRGAVSKQA